MMTEHFDAEHIHTTPSGRHFRHGDGVEVDGEGNPITTSEERAYKWAVANQGYAGTFAEWLALDADERAEYEAGAAGIPTA